MVTVVTASISEIMAFLSILFTMHTTYKQTSYKCKLLDSKASSRLESNQFN